MARSQSSRRRPPATPLPAAPPPAAEPPFNAIQTALEARDAEVRREEDRRQAAEERSRPFRAASELVFAADALAGVGVFGRTAEDPCRRLAEGFLALAAALREEALREEVLPDVVEGWTPPIQGVEAETVRACLRFAASPQANLAELQRQLFAEHAALRSPTLREVLVGLETHVRRVLWPGALKAETALAPPPDLAALAETLDGLPDAVGRAVEARGAEMEAELLASLPADDGEADDVHTSHSLEMTPGGFAYRGIVHDLTGRPRDVLQALLNSRHLRLTVSELRNAIRVDDAAVEYPDQVVKDAVKSLRPILNAAVAAAGVQCNTPLRSTGKGRDLTYILAVP